MEKLKELLQLSSIRYLRVTTKNAEDMIKIRSKTLTRRVKALCKKENLQVIEINDITLIYFK